MRVFLSIFGFCIFVMSVIFGFDLLSDKSITGGEFITLVIAFAVLGLIISFSSEVQEFSVAGNIVKLKEVKKDADKSISELKQARTETFRFLLKLATRFPGGFGSSGTVDPRLTDFWILYRQIVDFSCEDELADNIKNIVKVLIASQLYHIGMNSDDVSKKYPRDVIPTPSELMIVALDNESVEKAAKRNVCNGDINKIKEALVLGLDEYSKLYTLYEKY